MTLEDNVHRSQAVMEKVGETVSGLSAVDIMAVFSWIIGDLILQTKSDPAAIFHDFEVMVCTAIETMKHAEEGAPKGTILN